MLNRPYSKNLYNILETFSQVCHIAILYIGMFYNSASHYNFIKPWVNYMLLLVVALPNIIFIILWIGLMWVEILDYVKEKEWTFLFSILTCCCLTNLWQRVIRETEENTLKMTI